MNLLRHILFPATILFALWLDANPINIPDLSPAIERVMNWIDPAH